MAGNRGQVTIFVIIGIVLVVAIFAFFIFGNGGRIAVGQEFSPDAFFDSCIRASIREQAANILDYGGFVESKDAIVYNGLPVAYLCKNVNDYQSCVVQYPRLIYQIERELEKNTKAKMQSCAADLEKELDRRGFDSSVGPPTTEVILKPDVIEVKTYMDLEASKGDVSIKRKAFSSSLNSPVYNLAFLANEIVAQESNFCYFEYVGFGLLYSRYSVSVYKYSDYTKVYTILDKETGEKMSFAVRGCAVPGGY